MEWKTDEQRMFEWASAIGVTQPWPKAGMESGVHIPNPALSVWVFVPLARLAGDPVALVQIVQFLNVFALVGFLVVGMTRMVSAETRPFWFGGLALQAVNPLAVVLSRKIWAQSLMPMFTLTLLAAHACRRSVAGAFVWGLAGVLAGQVHMSGFFLCAALASWTAIAERRSVRERTLDAGTTTRWWAWLAGSVIGAIPLVPWVLQFLQAGSGFSRDWPATLVPRALYAWLVDALGINTGYVFRPDWAAFLSGPHVGGIATSGMALAHVALIGIALCSIVRWLPTLRPRLLPAREHGDVWLWICAAAFGVTAFLMLAGVRARTHYLIVLYPLPFVWLAWLLLRHGGVRLYHAALVLQLLITVAMLTQIHRDGGVPKGAYGVSYGAQPRR